jgi:hypothetical protein
MPQVREVRRWQPILAERGAGDERDIDHVSGISAVIPTPADGFQILNRSFAGALIRATKLL